MDLHFETVYENLSTVVREGIIDLSATKSFDPWTIGILSLLAIERKDKAEKGVVLPNDPSAKTYLRETNFIDFVGKLGYNDFAIERLGDPNIQGIVHSLFRDDFNARLSGIRSVFQAFGMSNEDDVNRATVLVGELGNNVFDHNEGVWPTEIRGAVILGQNYLQEKKVEVVVTDPGIGFRQSLRTVDPNLTDIEAIKLGLEGCTGRIGEERGNGLRLIQDWVINKFDGVVRIHSGSGLVVVDENGVRSKSVMSVLGTLAGFVIRYN